MTVTLCSARRRVVKAFIVVWFTAPQDLNTVLRRPDPSRRSRAATRCRVLVAGSPDHGHRSVLFQYLVSV